MQRAPAPDAVLLGLGSFIRAQRLMANLSLRQLSALAEVSNPYLSQVERGLHAPSVRVLRSIADALDLSAETLLAQAGLLRAARPCALAQEGDDTDANGTGNTAQFADTVRAISTDRRLSEPQRRALIAVYHSYVVDHHPDQ